MTDTRFIAVPGSERTPAFGATATRAADAEAWLEVTLKLARKAPLPARRRAPAAHADRRPSSARSTAPPTPRSSASPTPSPAWD